MTRWLAASLADCRPGDQIRIGQEVAIADRASLLRWHMGPGGYRSHEHDELRLDLSANPGLIEYPASTACEILCDQERAAVLLIQQTFPGTVTL